MAVAGVSLVWARRVAIGRWSSLRCFFRGSGRLLLGRSGGDPGLFLQGFWYFPLWDVAVARLDRRLTQRIRGIPREDESSLCKVVIPS